MNFWHPQFSRHLLFTLMSDKNRILCMCQTKSLEWADEIGKENKKWMTLLLSQRTEGNKLKLIMKNAKFENMKKQKMKLGKKRNYLILS